MQVLHAKSVGGMFANSLSANDAIGHHRRFTTARKGFKGLPSGTAFDKLLSEVTFSYLVFPSTIIVVSPTYVNILSCYPQSASETLVENFMLTPTEPKTDEEHEHWQRSWTLLDENVYESEDFYAAQLQQAGLSSGMLKELTLGGLELPISDFHKNLQQTLEGGSP